MHKLSLSVQYASSAAHMPTRQQFRRWVKAAMQHDLQITLRLVDENEGRYLNKSFRGKDYATNVLTFVYDETPPGLLLSGDESLQGDVILCASVVEREAREQRKDVLAHYAHMTIHAALHLQGYEHDAEDEAAAMEALETAIMEKLGYPSPY